MNSSRITPQWGPPVLELEVFSLSHLRNVMVYIDAQGRQIGTEFTVVGFAQSTTEIATTIRISSAHAISDWCLDLAPVLSDGGEPFILISRVRGVRQISESEVAA